MSQILYHHPGYMEEDFFERVRREAYIPDAMRQHLVHLRDDLNFHPKVIYDIGSAVMHFADMARQVWPDAVIVMFEAMDEVLPHYQQSPYKHFHIGPLTDRDGRELTYYQSHVHPSGSSYYREVGTPMSHVYFQPVPKVGISLATAVKQREFPLPDLIKIDVQGAEKDIIAGGEDVVRHAKHLIVEMQHTEYNLGAPRVEETLPYIESLGFKCDKPRLCSSPVDADYGFVRVPQR